jgi:putative protein-disulfide isomerase
MPDTIARLIYVGDPMCSWCWGFAPEIEALAAELPVEVVVGGLRPGPMAQPLTESMADALRHHWVQIQERTGQPFDMSGLERGEDWVYDTEPAARAVTQMRELNEEATLGYFTRVQKAFYAEGADVTDADVLTDLATEGVFDVDAEAFRSGLESEESKRRAWDDFTRARNWGISGFPTLIGKLSDGRLALLARGWAPAATIKERIASVA